MAEAKKYLTVEEFLDATRVPEREIELPGIGTVRLRGIGKLEGMRIAETVNGEAERLAHMLVTAFVEPALSLGQATAIYHARGEVFDVIVECVSELTNGDEAAKNGAAKE